MAGGTVSADGNTTPTGRGRSCSRRHVRRASLTGIPGTVDVDANYAPILTIPQDIQSLAAPDPTDITNGDGNVDSFEASVPHLRLVFGVADAAACLRDRRRVPRDDRRRADRTRTTSSSSRAAPQGAFAVWQNASFDPQSQHWYPLSIPEGNNVPMLWPLVILSKLVDSTPTPDANGQAHAEDPASLDGAGLGGAAGRHHAGHHALQLAAAHADPSEPGAGGHPVQHAAGSRREPDPGLRDGPAVRSLQRWQLQRSPLQLHDGHADGLPADRS